MTISVLQLSDEQGRLILAKSNSVCTGTWLHASTLVVRRRPSPQASRLRNIHTHRDMLTIPLDVDRGKSYYLF